MRFSIDPHSGWGLDLCAVLWDRGNLCVGSVSSTRGGVKEGRGVFCVPTTSYRRQLSSLEFFLESRDGVAG
jgi:hypothetical protein